MEKFDLRDMKNIEIDRLAWQWITHPTLMIDRTIVRSNIEAMVAKAAALGIRLRPHFKTHQSAEIGEWFREVGVDRITVSSIEMASYFADAGWMDITIAFPINLRAVAEINQLAQRIRLGILISDRQSVALLEAALTSPVQAWIELDTGDGRSGFHWEADAAIAATAQAIKSSSQLQLAGLLGHAGYTYRSMGADDVHQAHLRDITRLRHAVDALHEKGFHDIQVSTGDTPGCSRETDFGGADELRPGNFVFYDIQQQQISSCEFHQIGVALAAPIVAMYPERNEVIVHAGGVHLSKDALLVGEWGPIYGRIALPRSHGWSAPQAGCYVRSISQEHGIVVVTAEWMAQLAVGDLLAILPVHSCMTADLMGYLHPIDTGRELPPIVMMKAAHYQARGGQATASARS